VFDTELHVGLSTKTEVRNGRAMQCSTG